MVRTIIMTRICCVRVWFMGRHIYSYSLGNFPRINISYLVSNMITGSVNNTNCQVVRKSPTARWSRISVLPLMSLSDGQVISLK